MRLIVVLAVTVLAGCATPQMNSPYYSECEYEATKATPYTNNAFADVLRKQELINMCIRQKGG
ncbi:MAG: hypothetical protein ACSLE9_06665 [Burkholderiaceae bacterium]